MSKVRYSHSTGGRKKVLDATNWQTYPLVQKTQISPNTAIYRFGLPTPNSILGLPTGQHISVAAEIAGKEIMRSYTPTSSDDDAGHFDLLIKSYEKGNISRVFSLLKIGDTIKVKGPKGQFNYTADLVSNIGMIAGGTGITPMIQIIRAALKNSADKTKLSLIYANVNEEDILLKKELDALAAANPGQFKVYYVLNNPPQGWTGGVGFVSKDMIQTHLPASTTPSKVLMCGPPPMITAMKYVSFLNEMTKINLFVAGNTSTSSSSLLLVPLANLLTRYVIILLFYSNIMLIQHYQVFVF